MNYTEILIFVTINLNWGNKPSNYPSVFKINLFNCIDEMYFRRYFKYSDRCRDFTANLLSLCILSLHCSILMCFAKNKRKRNKTKTIQKEISMGKIIEMAGKLFRKVSGGSCAMRHSKMSMKRFLNQSFRTPPNSHFGPWCMLPSRNNNNNNNNLLFQNIST